MGFFLLAFLSSVSAFSAPSVTTNRASFWTSGDRIAALEDAPSADLLAKIRGQPYRGGFEPAKDVEKYSPRIVKGKIPSDLVGSLAGNGPGRIRIGDRQYGHWFDGDGYVTLLGLDGRTNEVSFQAKYVRTERYLKQQKYEQENPGERDPVLQSSGAWTPKGRGKWYENIMSIPTNPANTATMWVKSKKNPDQPRLLALCEGGQPYELDPATLEPIGKEGSFFDDTATPDSFFSAHFSRCPNGDIMNHGYKLKVGPGPKELNLVRLDATGNLLDQKSTALPFDTFTHDSTISSHNLVYFLPPWKIPDGAMLKFIKGQAPLATMYEWDIQDQTVLRVHSLEDLSLQWEVALPNEMSAYHFVDAHEEEEASGNGDRLMRVRVAELDPPTERVRQEGQFADQYRVSERRLFTKIIEYSFLLKSNGDKNDSLGVGQMIERQEVAPEQAPCEFPETNRAFVAANRGSRARYCWINALSSSDLNWLDGLQKIDMETGKVSPVASFGAGTFCGAPAFVPRTNDGSEQLAEDDGYILATVYRSEKHTSDVVILDAATMETMCVMELETHIPYQFHGDYQRGADGAKAMSFKHSGRHPPRKPGSRIAAIADCQCSTIRTDRRRRAPHNHMDRPAKAEAIEQVLAAEKIELWRLRELALTDGGLVNDDLRRIAWPKIVGLGDTEWDQHQQHQQQQGEETLDGRVSPTLKNRKRWSEGRSSPCSVVHNHTPQSPIRSNPSGSPHRDYFDDLEQIERDVCRCTFHLLSSTGGSQEVLLHHKRNEKVARRIRFKQRRLANLIHLTLLKAPEGQLRYYQGFHDVASIFLSTMAEDIPIVTNRGSSTPTVTATKGLNLAASVLLQASRSHLRDALKSTFQDLHACLHLTLCPLLARIDPEIIDVLMHWEMDALFALPWVLTWFSHDIKDTELVKRLFDVFLVSHPLMPIYVAVAMVTDRVNRQLILDAKHDFTSLYKVLQSLPQNSVASTSHALKRGHSAESLHPDNDDNLVCYVEVNEEFLALDFQPPGEGKKTSGGADPVDATSVSSATTGSDDELTSTAPLVPFQSLIDSAIRIMDKVPPSDLIALSQRFSGPEKVENLLQQSPDLLMLKKPAPWTIAETSVGQGSIAAKIIPNNNSADDEAFLKENFDKVAVIAAGFGIGDIARRRQRILFKKRMRRAFVCIAIVVFVVWLLRFTTSTTSSREQDL